MITNSEDAMKSTGIKKLYYSISEVSKITDLEQYVLRYWESEFEQLKPAKNRAGTESTRIKTSSLFSTSASFYGKNGTPLKARSKF